MLLVIIAGGLHSGMDKGGLSLLGAGGVAYLVTCYLPFVEYSNRRGRIARHVGPDFVSK